MKSVISTSRSSRNGFSLIEVLLAVFILGIGLIMVGTIFPVAGNWTRQSTDDTISQTISQNALSVIQMHYASGGNLNGNVSTITTALQGLPGFTNIPVSERTYSYGSSSPFPTQNPASATYYWTALARLQPNMTTSPTKMYDVYIFVFKKGEGSQTYYDTPLSASFVVPSGYTEVPNVRDTAVVTNPAGYDFHLEPTLIGGPSATGTYNASSGTVVGAVPDIGYVGVGATSGTVFKQGVDVTAGTAVARPGIVPGEAVIFAPPADGTGNSPLVYVYQTTVSF